MEWSVFVDSINFAIGIEGEFSTTTTTPARKMELTESTAHDSLFVHRSRCAFLRFIRSFGYSVAFYRRRWLSYLRWRRNRQKYINFIVLIAGNGSIYILLSLTKPFFIFCSILSDDFFILTVARSLANCFPFHLAALSINIRHQLGSVCVCVSNFYLNKLRGDWSIRKKWKEKKEKYNSIKILPRTGENSLRAIRTFYAQVRWTLDLPCRMRKSFFSPFSVASLCTFTSIGKRIVP